MPHRGEGPIPARVMAVGECWGQSEDEQGIPFVGYSGSELNKMLHEANLMRSEIFVSNVVNHRPPDNDLKHWIAFAKNQITPEHRPWRGWMVKQIVEEGHRQLLAEIEMVKPNVIVAFGNLALHALHQGHIVMKPQGPSGIRKWRGSLLKSDQGVKLIPSVHPAAVLRQWDWRPAAVNDLRRVKQHSGPEDYNFPKYNFRIRPSFGQATSILTELIRRLDAGEVIWLDTDFETGRRHRHIKCFGFSWSRMEALCLPFLALGHPGGYWSEDEETHVIYLLWKLLIHRNVRVRWQNGLFDVQHAYRYWHFIPRCDQDTMISQHSIFSDQPKTLAYQASIYSDDYIFWKDEGKTEIDMARTTKEEEEGWVYNCKDCTYTRQVGEAELAMIDGFAIVPHTHPRYWPHAKKVHDFQQAMFWPVLAAMNLGLKIREDVSKQLADEIQQQIHMREDFFKQVIGRDVNFGSSKQLQELFYDELGQQAIWTRAKKGTPAHITCDDEALLKIGTREPLLKPITQCIADVRTLEKFKSDFILAKRDVDGRMRCSFNIGGSESGKSAPKTYRLSSSKNAFGSGANLQTIPSEKSKSVGKWDARAKSHMALIGDPYSLPNLRSMYAPDPGHDQFDEDLDRADLQVMAWDADEPLLKEALKRKVDLHLLNVYVLDAKDPPPLEELVETHPKYQDHRGPRKTKREFAKIFCHATDYLGKARTVAAHTGRTVHETERAQTIYLSTYKGIAKWQQAIINQVQKHRFVENKFGYRWYIFDRIDDQVMPEAVAWIPQSTVSIVINRIWMNIYQGCLEDKWNLSTEHMMWLLHNPPDGIKVQLQVHDSLVGQFPSHMRDRCVIRLKELAHVVVPYDDPLVIPTGISTSSVTWGDC